MSERELTGFVMMGFRCPLYPTAAPNGDPIWIGPKRVADIIAGYLAKDFPLHGQWFSSIPATAWRPKHRRDAADAINEITRGKLPTAHPYIFPELVDRDPDFKHKDFGVAIDEPHMHQVRLHEIFARAQEAEQIEERTRRCSPIGIYLDDVELTVALLEPGGAGPLSQQYLSIAASVGNRLLSEILHAEAIRDALLHGKNVVSLIAATQTFVGMLTGRVLSGGYWSPPEPPEENGEDLLDAIKDNCEELAPYRALSAGRRPVTGPTMMSPLEFVDLPDASDPSTETEPQATDSVSYSTPRDMTNAEIRNKSGLSQHLLRTHRKKFPGLKWPQRLPIPLSNIITVIRDINETAYEHEDKQLAGKFLLTLIGGKHPLDSKFEVSVSGDGPD